MEFRIYDFLLGQEERCSNMEEIRKAEQIYPAFRNPGEMAFDAIKKANPRLLVLSLYVKNPTKKMLDVCISEYERECSEKYKELGKDQKSTSKLLSEVITGQHTKNKKLERIWNLLNCLGTLLVVSAFPEISSETASLKDKDKEFYSLKIPSDYADFIFTLTDKKSLLEYAYSSKAEYWCSFLYKTATSERTKWLLNFTGEILYKCLLLSTIFEVNGAKIGVTPMMSAIVLEDKEKVKILSNFKACKNLNHPMSSSNSINSVKSKDMFLFLMDKGFSPDLVDNSGLTLLSRLCSNKKTSREFLETVILYSNPNTPQKVLPLVWALFNDDFRLLEKLFERGADPIYAIKTTAQFPLISGKTKEKWEEGVRIWKIPLVSLKHEKGNIAKARIEILRKAFQTKEKKCLWWLLKHHKQYSIKKAVEKRNKTRGKIQDVEGRAINFGEYADWQFVSIQEAESGKKIALLSSLVQEFVDKESRKPTPRYDLIDVFASKGLVNCVPLSEVVKLLG